MNINFNEGFKLIAIMPLKGCSSKYLKILKEDTPYYFYNNYKISIDNSGVEKIIVSESSIPRIFDIDNLKINITAIAGKNGTGKSSLMEFIYVIFYNISLQQRLLPKQDEGKNLFKLQEGVNGAVYYSINSKIFKIEVNDFQHYLYEFNSNYIGYNHVSEINKKENFYLLFYNIVINYSHFSLNSKEIGLWINAIFHKNDGYQTPVVLTPYRKEGNIDVNNENHLVRSRLLVNILSGNTGLFTFGSKEKTPINFKFEIDYSKFRLKSGSDQILFEHTNKVKRFVIPAIFKIFYNDSKYISSHEHIYKITLEYIIKKIFSIAKNYKHYHRFNGFKANEEKFELYLLALKNDSTHITFKLKQALNFLRFQTLESFNSKTTVGVDLLSSRIFLLKEEFNIPLIELVPPAFLKFDIEFSEKGDDFISFSSGEKQKIFAFSSLTYHLKNIDSILTNSRSDLDDSVELLKYENVNIVFDEIELYFHPDLQRRFINDLLLSIKGSGVKSIQSLNLIFVTHSPFILSDIPTEQTLYLDISNSKATQIFPKGNTFAGNIHDLLSDNFFLDNDGFIGEHAKNLLKNVSRYLEQVIMKGEEDVDAELTKGFTRNSVRKMIDIIGEPLVKSSLNYLYSQAFLISPSDIDDEIRRLQSIRNNLSRK